MTFQRTMKAWLLAVAGLLGTAGFTWGQAEDNLRWTERTPIPDALGVAGPFVGVHNDALIVAGGANFPQPVWENDKQWHDRISVFANRDDDAWIQAGQLPRPIAYGASVSTPYGVVCMGGNDAEETFDAVFVLRWNADARRVEREDLPALPAPCAYGAATVLGDMVYLAGGQRGANLDTAMTNFWSLDLAKLGTAQIVWREAPPWPGPARAFNLTLQQHNGYDNCIYVISGRRQAGDDVEFLQDVWEYTPQTDRWRQRRNVPQCVMAGTGIGVGQSHLFVLGGASGELFDKADELRDKHPGFPKHAWAYHTITDTWTSAGEIPANHVTTTAVKWGTDIVIPSGEVRPRVRSPKVWSVQVVPNRSSFGGLNYVVLAVYLAAMVGIGFYFARDNKTTDDYFRGGKKIPWWAAGCSIFATMLSSLTFTGIPSKAFAQDWVYAVGNFMIPVVAVVAVYVALPFFRSIDATSAYEYLELRFDRSVRWLGSACFTLFHVFRMAVVMSLTGLALAVATPLSPVQSVLLMGILSILYCTMGGIEAVIWTDTIQTVVLLGGALVALAMLLGQVDGGLSGYVAEGAGSAKFRLANFHWDVTHARAALWVVVVGGLAQNVSSYTADQAVVQRYMTTPEQRLAARSIWTNALLSIPATLIFFGLGSALFVFYRLHPEKLDPTITTDQIFPLFIAREMPAGISGLIVAGIFAAAQSTVSTSMNSTATTVVTDFLRPRNVYATEAHYLRAARFLTLSFGVLGTALGVLFVDPNIRSLFEAFIKVVGIFMGVLGGLFVLGAATTRANARGALAGAAIGVLSMLTLWLVFTSVNTMIYPAVGVSTCAVSGYLASLLWGGNSKDLAGLTIHTKKKP